MAVVADNDQVGVDFVRAVDYFYVWFPVTGAGRDLDFERLRTLFDFG